MKNLISELLYDNMYTYFIQEILVTLNPPNQYIVILGRPRVSQI